MKARMKDNLLHRYIGLSIEVVDIPDEETQFFLESIEGKEVELVFTHGDAFEKQDNNIWLPDCLWDAI